MGIPNNPAKAFVEGKKAGTREMMSVVALVMIDKYGWQIRDPESRETIEQLKGYLDAYYDAINKREIRYRDIKDTLKQEQNIEIV